MEQGKISVVVPVYNGAKWIEECVKSVQAQTWTNWELLILDDRSSDGTDRIAQKMAEEDSRIRFVERRKKGVSSARNQGIEETDGEFLTFVDADDKLDARMFEVLADCLEKENSEMAVCDYYRWDGTENVLCDRSGRKIEESYTVKAEALPGRFTVDRDAYVGQYLLHGNTRCWSVLYRRSAVANVRFREDLTIGEDMMFLVDLMSGLKRITLTDYRGYFYRINENGAMLRPFTLSYMDEIKGWKLACEKISAGWPEGAGQQYPCGICDARSGKAFQTFCKGAGKIQGTGGRMPGGGAAGAPGPGGKGRTAGRISGKNGAVYAVPGAVPAAVSYLEKGVNSDER